MKTEIASVPFDAPFRLSTGNMCGARNTIKQALI
jgi:hypothetical protein